MFMISSKNLKFTYYTKDLTLKQGKSINKWYPQIPWMLYKIYGGDGGSWTHNPCGHPAKGGTRTWCRGQESNLHAIAGVSS